MAASVLPGTIGLTQISGNVGKLIEIGQWLNGDGFKDWEHAFLLGPGGRILEAEPGGARVGNVSEYSSIYWCTSIAKLTNAKTLTAVWAGAQKYTGVGYSFADYFALAAHRLDIPGPALKNYIASSGHLICSQLCDQAYMDQGVHLFTDNRWPGYVTPEDLYNLDQALVKA
jgi:hypothetical protein